MGLIDRLFGRKPAEAAAAPAIRNEVVTGLSFEDFAKLFKLDDVASGVTPRSAMDAIPVQACCALIAGGIASMPLRIVRRELVDGMMVQQPADNHDYWWLFNEQPNEDSTASAFWETVIPRKLLYDRAFVRIVRRANGRSLDVEELLPLENEQVQVDRVWDPVRRKFRISRYLVRDGAHTYGVLPEDMLDFRSPGVPCYSAASYQQSRILNSARTAIGIVLVIEDYCAKFFANGGMPRTVLQYPAGTALDEKQVAIIRDAWVRKYGGADNAGLPLVLGNGGQAQKLSFTAEEAQLLEARKFQVIDIARAFGVPPFMIGETEKTSAWGTGLEQLSQGFIRYTLGPHVTAIEQELNRKLFRISRYFVDFDEESLARGDMKALGDWFRQAVGGSMGPGFMTVNEIRSRLKLPPMDDGDDIYNPTGDSPDANAEGAGAGADPGAEGDGEDGDPPVPGGSVD